MPIHSRKNELPAAARNLRPGAPAAQRGGLRGARTGGVSDSIASGIWRARLAMGAAHYPCFNPAGPVQVNLLKLGANQLPEARRRFSGAHYPGSSSSPRAGADGD